MLRSIESRLDEWGQQFPEHEFTPPAIFSRTIPHSDGAGIIDRVGKGIDLTRIGERVWIWNAQWKRPFGTAAQCVVLP